MARSPDARHLPIRFNAPIAGFGRLLLRGMRWQTDGALPDRKKMVVIVAPHTSNWDFIVGVGVVFAHRLHVRFIGKHTLFGPPVLGHFMRWLGGIPVVRSERRGLVEQMVTAFHDNDELVLGIAPEGTRSHVDRWKTGFYYIALQAGVPIVPVALDYDARVVRFGEPFEPTGDADADLEQLYAFYDGVVGRHAHHT